MAVPGKGHRKGDFPPSPDVRPNTEHSRVDRKYSLQASSFHIQLILRKQKDWREMLQANSTLDAKTTMIHSFSIQMKPMSLQ